MRCSWDFKIFIVALCFALVAGLVSELPQKIRSINEDADYKYSQTGTLPAQSEKAEDDIEEGHIDGVYRTKYGKCYHKKDCQYLKSKIYISVEMARSRGLRPCKMCKPLE